MVSLFPLENAGKRGSRTLFLALFSPPPLASRPGRIWDPNWTFSLRSSTQRRPVTFDKGFFFLGRCRPPLLSCATGKKRPYLLCFGVRPPLFHEIKSRVLDPAAVLFPSKQVFCCLRRETLPAVRSYYGLSLTPESASARSHSFAFRALSFFSREGWRPGGFPQPSRFKFHGGRIWFSLFPGYSLSPSNIDAERASFFPPSGSPLWLPSVTHCFLACFTFCYNLPQASFFPSVPSSLFSPTGGCQCSLFFLPSFYS